MGAAPGGFGGIHREIRVLQDLVEIGAVLRRQRNADAGVGGDLVTEAFVGLPDRLEQPCHEVGHVAHGLDRSLNDREFIAAEPRDEIRGSDALPQGDGDRFQQFVADQMAERIVDALEFVDVEVKYGELVAGGGGCEFALQPVVEQGAVGQIGQCVVMRQMGDARLGAPSLGDVLVGRHPSAIGQRLVGDLDRAPVGRFDDHRIPDRDVAQDDGGVLIDIPDERSGVLAMGDHLAEAAARFHHLPRQAVHVDIALVADHEPPRRIEQQQALRHVVDGRVEPLLFQHQPLLCQAMLLRQLADDEKQHGRYDEHRKSAQADQEFGVRQPIGQHRGHGRRRGDHQRKMGEGARRSKPVLAVFRIDDAACPVADLRLGAQAQRVRPEFLSDHRVDMGMAGHQRAVVMKHGNRRTFSKRQRCEEFFEMGRLDTSADGSQQFAVRPGQLAGKDGRPGAGDATVHRLDQQGRRFRVRFEFLEIGPIGDADGRDWPGAR